MAGNYSFRYTLDNYINLLTFCFQLNLTHPKIIMDELTNDLKKKLIEVLNLTDITPEEIDENEQLVGGDLGIDSIDVLEMVVMVEKEYGVVINNKDIGEKVFSTLAALTDYIRENSPTLAS
ncbi:acyl carrier protein [Desulfocapsa sulfexigens DSM 10523]|uniref:Acyl carrier protein n=2 Tax=Desulfocapsa TaxID=53318 RepID=M1NZM1_DESSD|nr:acyl carrier protein [Desulfocapsa sulfexigens DSM 10523]